MKTCFTICANNYLAEAKALGDSWLRHHSDSRFIIFLVDQFNPAIDYSQFGNIELVDIQRVNIPDLDQLVLKYNITEFSTAVKPYIFTYLFKQDGQSNIIYLDPDIYVFQPLTEVFTALRESNIIITPHILTGVDDDRQPTDFHTLRGGVFNLGFIALSDYGKVKTFLDWWTHRTAKYGFGKLEAGMFYDQLWINYVPSLFDNYLILKHPGYNMANWNLHERLLTQASPGYFVVNGKYPLVFFHYSGYRWQEPDRIGHYHTRFDFATRPDLRPVFEIYRMALMDNKVDFFKSIPCVYYEQHKAHQAMLQKEYERVRPSLTRRVIGKILFRLKTKGKTQAAH